MRINVDLDNCSQLRFLMTYFNMARFCQFMEVYETTNGYHIIGYGFPDVDMESFYNFRLMWGDDPLRVWLDQRYHSKPEQVLFTRRVHIDDEKPAYRHRILNILWKPWISKTPAKKPAANGKSKKLVKR